MWCNLHCKYECFVNFYIVDLQYVNLKLCHFIFQPHQINQHLTYYITKYTLLILIDTYTIWSHKEQDKFQVIGCLEDWEFRIYLRVISILLEIKWKLWSSHNRFNLSKAYLNSIIFVNLIVSMRKLIRIGYNYKYNRLIGSSMHNMIL